MVLATGAAEKTQTTAGYLGIKYHITNGTLFAKTISL